MTAAAPSDPRLDRFRLEWELLQQLNQESDTVLVEPIGPIRPAPLQYMARFFCRGIVGKDSSGIPKFADEHRCRITITQRYPTRPPDLYWETDIWHPNISHITRGVCVQEIEWLASHTLVDLCRMLFDMVQYKNYHAEHIPPYPLDADAARWVREVAEPRGYVNKALRNYADDQPFTRPIGAGVARVSVASPPAAPASRSGVRLLSRPISTAASPPPGGTRTIRILKQP